MAKASASISVFDLVRDASGVLDRLHESSEPLILTNRGRDAAMLIDIEAYRKSEHDRQLLLLLARGELDIAAGEGIALEEVLQAMDDLLAEDQA